MICFLGSPYNSLYSVNVIWCRDLTCFLNPERVITWSQQQQKVLHDLVGSLLIALTSFDDFFVKDFSPSLSFLVIFPFCNLVSIWLLNIRPNPHILPGLLLRFEYPACNNFPQVRFGKVEFVLQHRYYGIRVDKEARGQVGLSWCCRVDESGLHCSGQAW